MSTSSSPASKRKFNPSLGAEARYLERELKKALKYAEDNFKAQHQKEMARFRIIRSTSVRIRSPGSPEVLKEIIRRIFTPEGAKGTQTAIREAVQQIHPQRAVYKDWGHTLPPYAQMYAQTTVLTSASYFRSLAIPREVTLRQLHRMAKTTHAMHSGTARTYKPTIALTEESVLINNETIAVSTNKIGKHSYKSLRISITKLEELLQQRTSE